MTMKSCLDRFPHPDALREGLRTVFGGNPTDGGNVIVLRREPAVWASTYPSEIVTCRVESEGELKLYCKYALGPSYESYGHRGGPPYEAEVYRRVLSSVPIPVPTFYGAYPDAESGGVWLILQYLDQSSRVTKGPQPRSILAAAEWLGRFHSAVENRVSSPAVSFLKRYDVDYYSGWVHRTWSYARSLRTELPWLATLCERSQESFVVLLEAQPTIIHGEFYPHNILLSRGTIYPIDWESAAIAPGEIDLAMLTEAWGPDDVRECELVYRRARWNGASSDAFERRLAVARLYLCFRWLGDQPVWTVDEENRFYFDQMRSIGENIGLI